MLLLLVFFFFFHAFLWTIISEYWPLICYMYTCYFQICNWCFGQFHHCLWWLLCISYTYIINWRNGVLCKVANKYTTINFIFFCSSMKMRGMHVHKTWCAGLKKRDEILKGECLDLDCHNIEQPWELLWLLLASM